MKPRLISFPICPFVQRSVIVLNEKGVDFDIEHIELQDPPAWFRELSPTGKVPVLQIGDDILFESSVIMEYLDETHPPTLHPADPLLKARNRAWIEFASELIMEQFRMVTAKEEGDFDDAVQGLQGKMTQLEPQVQGPCFNGDDFSLADAAYAPLLMRLAMLEEWHPQGLLDDLPRIAGWGEQLLQHPSVRDSAIDDLAGRYRRHIAASGGYGARFFGG